MLSITTAWLHEASTEPLQIFDKPSEGKCMLRWAPGDGKAYVISFMQVSPIEQERLGIIHPILASFHQADEPDRVYSQYIPARMKCTEGDLAKAFRMKRTSRLTALYALIHFALPEYEKRDGKQAWEVLLRDTKTKD